MIDQIRSQHSFSATSDATRGGHSSADPQQFLSEPQSPTRELRVTLHNDPARRDQNLLTDVQLQALDVHAGVDCRGKLPEIDLGLWHTHACRPYLINFATKMPTYEVKRITQDAEEHRHWIKDDLLRTRDLLSTLNFDEIKRIQEQEQRAMEKIGLRKRLVNILKRASQHDAPREQQSRDDAGSVRSDGSGASLETAISKSSQTSESAMNDVEQSYAQLRRTLEEIFEEVHQKFSPTSTIFSVVNLETRDLEAAVSGLKATLEIHQDNAREVGFSDVGLAIDECHQSVKEGVLSKLKENKLKYRRNRYNKNSKIGAEKVRRTEEYAAMIKIIADVGRQVDDIMAEGRIVFDEFFNKSLLYMDVIVHSVAQETNYQVNDIVDNSVLVKREFIKKKNKKKKYIDD